MNHTVSYGLYGGAKENENAKTLFEHFLPVKCLCETPGLILSSSTLGVRSVLQICKSELLIHETAILYGPYKSIVKLHRILNLAMFDPRLVEMQSNTAASSHAYPVSQRCSLFIDPSPSSSDTPKSHPTNSRTFDN
jgi:hypothetical protein